MNGPGLSARAATTADADEITQTVALAFAADPIWGPALAVASGDTAHALPFWRHFVDGALACGLSTMIDGPGGEAAAVALWIAPGEPEMSDAAAESLEALVRAELDPESVAPMLELWELFDANHPADPPHAYLNFLATHPDHRGQGIAQGLLAESLVAFDAGGIPTYLESTNPVNNHRYERAGYERVGEFTAPHTGATVARMWRDAR